MRLLCLFLLSLLLVSASAKTLAQTSTEKKGRSRIVPGKSIGPFQLGVSEAEFDVLGKGVGEQTQGRKHYFYWPPESEPLSPLASYFAEYTVRDDDGGRGTGRWRVTTIRVTSHRYATAQGITTHSTFAEIKRAFPHLKRVSEETAETEVNTATYADDALGIGFDITEDASKGTHACYGIYVYPAHTDRMFWIPRLSPAD